ncbi:TIGR03546 family protein [Brucepastera parasyntrophica]|uniref:TIGR03546 family protein n=1 Tax=Brucepastera parasyntrophica TaxID=2880008 RepID=UPI002109EA5B|nr:TIGR03546 family protein [Brucepastera parasyntrophica]ULQ59008.1 TIGR03546 family protein [Brucepastera parasyntrophica]
MFKYIKLFFRSLNANAHPGDIAHAVALGFLLALVPKGNLLWIFLFCLVLFIRVNKGAFFISLILLSFIVPLADSLLDSIGYAVLSFGPMQPAYTVLYQTPFVAFTGFNNTIVAGAFVTGVVLYIPLYFGVKALIVQYRKVLQPKISQSKFVKFFSSFPLSSK